MGKRTRKCYLCNTKYEYCPTCSQDKNKPAFMATFHSESCKNIFQICTNFNLGIQTKSEAKAALEQCDLSNKENFKSYIQNDLAKIFAEEPKLKRGKRAEMKILDDVIAHEVVETIENE